VKGGSDWVGLRTGLPSWGPREIRSHPRSHPANATAICKPCDRPTWAYVKATRRSLRLLLRHRSERARQKAAWAGCRPHEVEPRILSDSSLRRYLGPGLETLAARLAAAGVPVRSGSRERFRRLSRGDMHSPPCPTPP
jgi:hypothetical protein